MASFRAWNPKRYRNIIDELTDGSRNPAEMSQKDWHAVTRNNSLMNGHRLVFTPGGTDAKGTTVPVKFRRIERAPYSGMLLNY